MGNNRNSCPKDLYNIIARASTKTVHPHDDYQQQREKRRAHREDEWAAIEETLYLNSIQEWRNR